MFPRTKQGDFSWKNIRETFNTLNKSNYFIARIQDGEVAVYHKYREQQVLKNIWIDKKYQSEFNGTNLLKDIIGENSFDYPKSVYAVSDVLKLTAEKSNLILDYFSGSGTSAHATISLNREDGGHRKYILVEQGEYFDTVIKAPHPKSGLFRRMERWQSHMHRRRAFPMPSKSLKWKATKTH